MTIFYSSLFGKFQLSKRHCLKKKWRMFPHTLPPKLHFLGVKKKGSFFFFFSPTVSLLAPWKHLVLISHEETEAVISSHALITRSCLERDISGLLNYGNSLGFLARAKGVSVARTIDTSPGDKAIAASHPTSLREFCFTQKGKGYSLRTGNSPRSSGLW